MAKKLVIIFPSARGVQKSLFCASTVKEMKDMNIILGMRFTVARLTITVGHQTISGYLHGFLASCSHDWKRCPLTQQRS